MAFCSPDYDHLRIASLLEILREDNTILHQKQVDKQPSLYIFFDSFAVV
jgi:hypothetical protein